MDNKYVNLGISVQFAEIVDQIRKNKVNIRWANAMLQRIIENDHKCDTQLLCPTFLKLTKPSPKQVGELLEVENYNYNRPFEENGEQKQKLFNGFNLNDGPDEIELVRVSAKTLFERNLDGSSEITIRKKASQLFGLTSCPAWVVPAIGIKSIANYNEDREDGYTQLMVCLSEAEQESLGSFNVIYGNNWWIHKRTGNLDDIWEDVVWLMAKS